MSQTCSKIAWFVAVLICSPSCWAQAINMVNPECPGYKPGNSWSDYLSLKLPGSQGVGVAAGVEFRKAKSVSERLPAGIDPGRCYVALFYHGTHNRQDGYTSYIGDKQVRSHTEHHLMEGLPGNPSEHEINIQGAQFDFDDAGEIKIRNTDKVVGQLVCVLVEDCSQYKY